MLRSPSVLVPVHNYADTVALRPCSFSHPKFKFGENGNMKLSWLQPVATYGDMRSQSPKLVPGIGPPEVCR